MMHGCRMQDGGCRPTNQMLLTQYEKGASQRKKLLLQINKLSFRRPKVGCHATDKTMNKGRKHKWEENDTGTECIPLTSRRTDEGKSPFSSKLYLRHLYGSVRMLE